jgi:hypothetical protein
VLGLLPGPKETDLRQIISNESRRMSALLLVMSVFGLILAALALGTYHFARWFEGRKEGRWSSRRKIPSQARRRAATQPSQSLEGKDHGWKLRRLGREEEEVSRDRITHLLLVAWGRAHRV